MSEVIQGARVLGKRRAPKAIEEPRRCVAEGCDTRLSRYNGRDHCFAHAPVKYPRLRGTPPAPIPDQA
jgi:hypothetical protein